MCASEASTTQVFDSKHETAPCPLLRQSQVLWMSSPQGVALGDMNLIFFTYGADASVKMTTSKR